MLVLVVLDGGLVRYPWLAWLMTSVAWLQAGWALQVSAPIINRQGADFAVLTGFSNARRPEPPSSTQRACVVSNIDMVSSKGMGTPLRGGRWFPGWVADPVKGQRSMATL